MIYLVILPPPTPKTTKTKKDKETRQVRASKNLSADLRRIKKSGLKKNLKLFILFSFAVMYMEIHA